MKILQAGCFLLFFVPDILFAQPSILEAVEKSRPSVVSIFSENRDAFRSTQAAAAFDKKTGKVIVLRPLPVASYQRYGAGVIIDATGLIVTNAHVVIHAKEIAVKFHDGSSLPAKISRIIPDKDLAFIQVEATHPFVSVALADSSAVHLGDEVVTIGNSEFLNQTVSAGRVIGIGANTSRAHLNSEDIDVIQVNINIYKGDSGGPLLNREGQLVGIMVAGQMKKDHSSFAIPVKKIKEYYLGYRTQSLQQSP